MVITSFQFLGFILATLVVFRLVSERKQWIVLLIASVIFYLSFSIGGIFIMIATALLTYIVAIKVEKHKNEYAKWLEMNKKSVDRETRKAKKNYYQNKQKALVVSAVVITVGVLFLCKYYSGFAIGVNGLLNTKIWTAENILLPLGISYYSLQLIGYLVDVYRDIIPAEKNPLKVILYGAFFLSIMQGPFNRYSQLMPQICVEKREKLTYPRIKHSILRIAGGYIKKMCIADQVAVIANEVFTNYSDYSGLGILLGIVCFAIQLYADFSGYMDIIIGIGELFDIQMPENFRQPFFSRNMSEFWQRWHITLGAWLKDYLFYPILKSNVWKNMGKALTKKIGKEAGRRIPTYLGMIVLWTTIGAWHGAGLNYVFGVGVLQFIYIFFGEICLPITEASKRKLRINDGSLLWHIFQSLRCTVLMMFAWVFFNSSSFKQAIALLKRFLTTPSLSQMTAVIYSDGVSGEWINWLIYIVICIIVLIGIDLLHENNIFLRQIVNAKSYPVRLLFYLMLAFALIVLGAYGEQYNASNFIYFDF